ncbi:MAG: hypothetical protein COA65_04420 [Rhodospirillaceae bacterium]|nr:MAG: hypothetical protein COA65_04420 [Rhodospirillaceae bacterium]
MVELLRTNEPVLLSLMLARLEEEAIPAVVLDTYMSILEGSAAAIPRRLMVAEAGFSRAREILQEVEAMGNENGT